MVWPVKTHPAQSTGPENKKNSGDWEHFSLDFSFYRTGYLRCRLQATLMRDLWKCGRQSSRSSVSARFVP
jgi:hypothetical protein